MGRRIPPEAYSYYLGLGVGRSYEAVAKRFGVSKRAVTSIAVRENWRGRVAEQEEKMHRESEKKVEESLEEMNERHIRALKAVQGRAIEALREKRLKTAMEAATALDRAIRCERTIRGEPADRAEISILEKLREENRRWLTFGPDEEGLAEAVPSS